MKTIYNLEALVSVQIRDKIECQYLEYRPFKKSFWGNKKEGFYSAYRFSEQTNPYTKKEIENGIYNDIKFLVEDNIVYFFPNVKLVFTNGKEYNKEFKTYAEAISWGEEQANKGMSVKLVIE